MRPRSLTLLLAAFSAFGFAREVPGSERPGVYRRVLADGQVRGPVAVLHSRHDRALSVLYPLATGGSAVERGAKLGRAGRIHDIVATSAIGATGARGAGAPELSLLDVQQAGLPRRPIVNIDGSDVIRAQEPLVGAHRDIVHREVATLVLLAAGLLEGAPEGARPTRLTPFASA